MSGVVGSDGEIENGITDTESEVDKEDEVLRLKTEDEGPRNEGLPEQWDTRRWG